MQRIILTDIDDTVFSWRDRFELWVLQQNLDVIPKSFGPYWSIAEWLGCTEEYSNYLVSTFNHLPDVWPRLRPFKKSAEYVKKLHIEQGFRFIGITSCSTDAWTVFMRKKNLLEAFDGAFSAVHCLGLGASKTEYLKRYSPTYWVEDKWSNAIAGAELGHRTFLINHEFNSKEHDERITRVNDWEEIYNHITNL